MTFTYSRAFVSTLFYALSCLVRQIEPVTDHVSAACGSGSAVALPEPLPLGLGLGIERDDRLFDGVHHRQERHIVVADD